MSKFFIIGLQEITETVERIPILTTTFLISLDDTIVETMSGRIFFPITMNW